MAKCNCVYEPFCSMLNGADIVLPTPCEYRKDNTNFVEVVRCRDCMFKQDPKQYGELQCVLLDIPMNNDNFCSYGRRKEGDPDATY